MDNWIRNQTTAGVQLNHASSNFCVEILAKKNVRFHGFAVSKNTS